MRSMPGKKERQHALEKLARRSLIFSIPVAKHTAYAEALAAGRAEHGEATNEELLAYYLRDDGKLPADFVLFEDSAPVAKPKAKKSKKAKVKAE